VSTRGRNRGERGLVDVVALVVILGLALPVIAAHRARPPRPIGPLAACVARATPRCPAVVASATVVPVEVVERILRMAAHDTGVSPRLLRAVADHESGLDPSAISDAGALGVLQTLPEVARDEGCSTIQDVRCEVYAGARHLARLLAAYRGNVTLALAAYNAGPGAVARYHGVPPYPETRAYVAGIVAEAGAP
jgi:soluble lytic murein transglycosylase-like protein